MDDNYVTIRWKTKENIIGIIGPICSYRCELLRYEKECIVFNNRIRGIDSFVAPECPGPGKYRVTLTKVDE